MKKVYYIWVDEQCCDLFFNEEQELIGNINENDADYRSEYFNPIMKKMGLDFIRIDQNDETSIKELLGLSIDQLNDMAC